ncbi:MAG: hypothetical protein A4E57_04645 [Syntrophorhabdaceae bacterium PtaU1.Bin034]|nr:MAG: hypothetical protein A4E57_04645 [Syntrophorhabdaceae bacterium PtaU1.Bin034]
MVQERDENYEHLSNEELHRLLCERIPEMELYPVTDETRNTAIAMLKMTPDVNGLLPNFTWHKRLQAD